MRCGDFELSTDSWWSPASCLSDRVEIGQFSGIGQNVIMQRGSPSSPAEDTISLQDIHDRRRVDLTSTKQQREEASPLAATGMRVVGVKRNLDRTESPNADLSGKPQIKRNFLGLAAWKCTAGVAARTGSYLSPNNNQRPSLAAED